MDELANRTYSDLQGRFQMNWRALRVAVPLDTPNKRSLLIKPLRWTEPCSTLLTDIIAFK